MKQTERRLSALEANVATLQPPKDQITLSEWRHWNETGVQPDRWRKVGAIQAYVSVMQARSVQAEELLALLDTAYAQLDGDT